MNLREAAQQALEALIWTTGSEDFSEVGQAHEGALKLLFPAITALRAALAQPEPRNQCGETCERAKLCAVCARGIAEDAMQRLTDVQQEMEGDKLSLPFNHIADANKMVATIRTEVTVEPVAWSYTDAKGRTVVVIANTAPYEDAKPLYSAPPKRKPISTDMILATWAEECIPKRSTPELVVAFARAIERAHGIWE